VQKIRENSNWLAGCPWNQWEFFGSHSQHSANIREGIDFLFLQFELVFLFCSTILINCQHAQKLEKILIYEKHFFFVQKQIVLNRYYVIKSDDRTW